MFDMHLAFTNFYHLRIDLYHIWYNYNHSNYIRCAIGRGVSILIV